MPRSAVQKRAMKRPRDEDNEAAIASHDQATPIGSSVPPSAFSANSDLVLRHLYRVVHPASFCSECGRSGVVVSRFALDVCEDDDDHTHRICPGCCSGALATQKQVFAVDINEHPERRDGVVVLPTALDVEWQSMIASRRPKHVAWFGGGGDGSAAASERLLPPLNGLVTLVTRPTAPLLEWLATTQRSSLRTLALTSTIDDGVLASLRALETLEILSLSQCEKVTVTGLSHLASFRYLSALAIQQCPAIAGASTVATFGTSFSGTLAHLNVCGCNRLEDAALHHIATTFPLLSSLHLTNCVKVSDKGVAHLKSLSNLRLLDLTWCKKVTSAGLVHLAALPLLEVLSLVSCENITDDGLASVGRLKSLRSLKLSRCEKVTAKGIEKLKSLPNIRLLDLDSCPLVNDACLAVVGSLVSLKSLNVSCCDKITGVGITHLQSLPHLQVLDVSCLNNVKKNGLAAVVAMPQLRQLDASLSDHIVEATLQPLLSMKTQQPPMRILSFSMCAKITDSALRCLSSLVLLEELDLVGCDKISDQGISHLSCLVRLRTLKLGSCELITDRGLSYLQTLVGLQALKLSFCKKITDSGLAHIRPLSRLSTLDLSWCEKIGDVGLAHLASLRGLQSLSLCSCAMITNVGVTHLAALKELQVLDLRFCKKITKAGVDLLAFVPHLSLK